MARTVPKLKPTPSDDAHLKWAEVLQREPDLWQDFLEFLRGLDKGLERDYDAANLHEEFLRIQAMRRFIKEVEFRASSRLREESDYAGRPK